MSEKLPALFFHAEKDGSLYFPLDAREQKDFLHTCLYVSAAVLRAILLRYDDESNSCAADLEELLSEYEK